VSTLRHDDGANGHKALRTLVVDDSPTYRRILETCLRDLAGVEYVGSASDGPQALSQARLLAPDLVLLDVDMPEMSGVELIPRLLAIDHRLSILMVSALTTRGAEVTIRSLSAGAFDFVAKPTATHGENGVHILRLSLRGAIDALRQPARPPCAPRVTPTPSHPGERRVAVVGIAVSTGGPRALAELLPRLPASFPLPILIVQHMPEEFTAALAASLDRRCALTVREAADGARVAPGHVLLARGGWHLRVHGPPGRELARVERDAPVHDLRPSADVLFESLATVYDGAVLGVVMTGMGADGLEGVRRIRALGGYCVAQSQESCAVYGMPRAVIESGQADEVVALADLDARLLGIASAARARGTA